VVYDTDEHDFEIVLDDEDLTGLHYDAFKQRTGTETLTKMVTENEEEGLANRGFSARIKATQVEGRAEEKAVLVIKEGSVPTVVAKKKSGRKTPREKAAKKKAWRLGPGQVALGDERAKGLSSRQLLVQMIQTGMKFGGILTRAGFG
jgi:hypothetical protein